LVEILFAMATFAALLVPLSQLYFGAGQRVVGSRAQLLLRVRCMEGLEEGRYRLHSGELKAAAGASFVEGMEAISLQVRVERPPGLLGAVVLVSQAEDARFAYRVRRVVAIPGLSPGES
jgi:hypothetical protein